MKKFFFIGFFILLVLSLITWHQSKPGNIISILEKRDSIRSGTLKYKIYVLWILPVGEAFIDPVEIKEYKGAKVYYLKATAQTFPEISGIFKASAAIESYIEMNTLDPVLFKQSISIPGKPIVLKEVTYDQIKNIMSLDGIKREVLPHTQDTLSAFNKIRQADFTKNKSVSMNINTNQKNYILEGSAREGGLTLQGKNYNLVYAKSQIRRREKNNPYHRSRINIVLLNSDNGNIPILIKVFASGFPITARLVEIK